MMDCKEFKTGDRVCLFAWPSIKATVLDSAGVYIDVAWDEADFAASQSSTVHRGWLRHVLPPKTS